VIHVTSDGDELYVRELGEGPPVLLVHPLLLDGTVWAHQHRALSQARRVVVPDLLGHGRSGPLIDPVVDFDRLADDVVELAEEADQPCDVVGLSLGGLFATMAAVRRPDLVRSVTLLSVPFGTDNPAYARYREEMAALAVRESRDAVYRRFAEYIFGQAAPLFARARYKQMLATTPHETFVAVLAAAARNDVDRHALLSQLDVPTLFAVGADDGLYGPELAREQAGQLADARVEVVPGGGRLLPIETPERLSEILGAFLDELDAGHPY
jgi:pimeloyl-ACP methyl ester carboxylesterase